MTTIRLHAGNVVDFGSTFGAGGGLTGSGALWDDASDASYLESVASPHVTIGQAQAVLDPLTVPVGATVTDVTFNIRLQQTAGAYQTHISVIVEPDTHLTPRFGPSSPTGDVQGVSIASSGSILDLAIPATDLADWSMSSLADLADLLAQPNTIITARNVPNVSGGVAIASTIRVYELSVDVTYTDPPPIDLPCNTWLDLPLGDAVFLTPTTGQYSDGVIWPLSGAFPDFYFPGLSLDPVKNYQVEITYNPASSHDEGTRQFWLSGVVGNEEQTTISDAQFGGLFNNSVNTTDVTNVVIGPDSTGSDTPSYWSDPDAGVSAGFDNIWFETDHGGAVSRIRIMKVCPTDGPSAPTDGAPGSGDAGEPGAGVGGPSAPTEGSPAPGGIIPPGAGFLVPGRRRQAPMVAEVLVDGHWLSLQCPWGALTYSHTWPGGSANATWTATGIPNRLTHRGLPVEIRYAGQRVWAGVLDLPGGDGTMNAIGLATLGQNYAALDADNNATNVPDDAIDAAISRGLAWKRRDSISSSAADVDISGGPVKLGDLLDAAATDLRLRWAVDPDGYVYAAPDPAAPTGHILYLDAPLTPADASVATALIGVYRSSSGIAKTDPVVADSAAWLGYSEDTVDLTSRGVLTSGQAVDKLQALLDLGRALPAWADPISVSHGDLLTQGQVAQSLETFAAGQMVRVHGQFGDTRLAGGGTTVDVVVGASELADQVLTLTPMSAPIFGLYDAITQLQKGA